MWLATINFVVSVRPHGTTRLPLDGFWWNMIFEAFSKICRENSGCIKIRQKLRVLYVKTFSHMWQHLAEFFLEQETLQIKVVEKNKTYFTISDFFFFSKILPFIKCRKNLLQPERKWTIWRLGVAYWISQPTGAQANAGALAPTSTHPLTQTPPPPTNRPICNTYCSPRQQRFRQCTSVLRYAHIACLVCLVFLLKPHTNSESRTLGNWCEQRCNLLWKWSVRLDACVSNLATMHFACSFCFCGRGYGWFIRKRMPL